MEKFTMIIFYYQKRQISEFFGYQLSKSDKNILNVSSCSNVYTVFL
jgi:hypothetical protein